MNNSDSADSAACADVLKKLVESMELVNTRLQNRSWFERRRDYSDQTIRDVKNWWNK